jgi:hypothetical protein
MTSQVRFGDGNDLLIVLASENDGSGFGWFYGGEGNNTLQLSEVKSKYYLDKYGSSDVTVSLKRQNVLSLEGLFVASNFNTIIGSDSGGEYSIYSYESTDKDLNSLVLGAGRDKVTLENVSGLSISLGGGSDKLSINNSKNITFFTAGNHDYVEVKNSQVTAILNSYNDTINFNGENKNVSVLSGSDVHNVNLSGETSSYIQIDGNYNSVTNIDITSQPIEQNIISLTTPYVNLSNTFLSLGDNYLEIGSIYVGDEDTTKRTGEKTEKFNNYVKVNVNDELNDSSLPTNIWLELFDSTLQTGISLIGMDSLIQAMSAFDNGSDLKKSSTMSLTNNGGISLLELSRFSNNKLF